MVSCFGKYTRELRTKNNESLRQMASRLGVSPSFLSMMEVGRKQIPLEYANKIISLYNLNKDESIKLEDAILETNKHVDIELEKMNDAQKEVSLIFARRIKDADPELVEKLRKVLENDKD